MEVTTISEPIDYTESLHQLTGIKDAATLLHTLCKAAGISLPSGKTSPGGKSKLSMQCVICPPGSICQEVEIFDLDCAVLNTMIRCTFAHILTYPGSALSRHIYDQYAIFFTAGDPLPFEEFSLMLQVQLQNLYEAFQSSSDANAFYCHLISREDFASYVKPCSHANNYFPLVAYITKILFLDLLAEEIAKAEYSLCQRFLRLENELVTLATRITELATNTRGGISGVTETLRRFLLPEANRYFEDHDFDDLFDAAEEIAETLEKIAKIYRKRLAIFKKLSQSLICGRPEPPVKAPIRDIPILPPIVLR